MGVCPEGGPTLLCGVFLLLRNKDTRGVVLIVYWYSIFKGAQDAQALVSRRDAGILRSWEQGDG